jgi:three-Cys-motif partner protein
MSPASDSHFEEFGPHTLLKHAILRYYVERWARILLSIPGTNCLRIVDACAGEGGDAAGRPGSPVIAMVEAAKAAEQMSRSGETKLVEVVAVEKRKAAYAALAERIGTARNVELVRGTLADVLPAQERDYRRIPHLYFIDPFGLEPLRADLVRRALSGRKNEVLLLFAGQAALRHFGVVQALERAENTVIGDLFESVGEATPPLPNPHLTITAEKAAQIMDAAFGDQRWRAIERHPQIQRAHAFLQLYTDLLREFGARFVFPQPIIDDALTSKYYLVYATKAPRGYEVMKNAVARALRDAPITDRARRTMEAIVAAPLPKVLQAVVSHFAGASVPWEAENGPCVRDFALSQTGLMHNQTKGLRDLLKPYQISSGREAARYTFPRAT